MATTRKAENVKVGKLYGKNIAKVDMHESAVVSGIDVMEIRTVSGTTIKITIHESGTVVVDMFPAKRGDNFAVYDVLDNKSLYNKFERCYYPKDESTDYFQVIQVETKLRKPE